MRIELEAEDRIRLTREGDDFAFDPVQAQLSPFHLLAASLATCTHSVLLSWAEQANLVTDGLEIVVAWELGGDPYRVTGIEMQVVWPELPEPRREAARRVASHCTVHRTLEHALHVETTLPG